MARKDVTGVKLKTTLGSEDLGVQVMISEVGRQSGKLITKIILREMKREKPFLLY